jgi:hypothetical protein
LLKPFNGFADNSRSETQDAFGIGKFLFVMMDNVLGFAETFCAKPQSPDQPSRPSSHVAGRVELVH